MAIFAGGVVILADYEETLKKQQIAVYQIKTEPNRFSESVSIQTSLSGLEHAPVTINNQMGLYANTTRWNDTRH